MAGTARSLRVEPLFQSAEPPVKSTAQQLQKSGQGMMSSRHFNVAHEVVRCRTAVLPQSARQG